MMGKKKQVAGTGEANADLDAQQRALDWELLLERVQKLQAARLKLDQEVEALTEAKREVRHRTRTVKEAQASLAYWQRVVERGASEKGASDV